MKLFLLKIYFNSHIIIAITPLFKNIKNMKSFTRYRAAWGAKANQKI